jgi:hypothetical protein
MVKTARYKNIGFFLSAFSDSIRLWLCGARMIDWPDNCSIHNGTQNSVSRPKF